MKFSDMMGSGGDRPPKHKDETDSETAIADAIAPYLDNRPEPVPVVEVEALRPVEPIATDEPIAADERFESDESFGAVELVGSADSIAFAEPAAPAPPPAVPAMPIAPPTEPVPPPLAPAAAQPFSLPEPPQPRRAWQPERSVPADIVPARAPAPAASATAIAIADFTPPSDDLLPSRRR